MKIMQYAKILLFTFLLAVFPILAPAQQDSNVGCCLNPGASALACSTERLSTLSECCPKPESANPGYYTTSSGPQNFNECQANFFFSGQSCDAVNQCRQGCCCSDISGEIKTQSQCSGTGLVFHPGETECNAVCNVPQCNDGIDNDGNGCRDFPVDSGCTSLFDISESNGVCLASSGANCDNINYAPKITNFKALPVKGQKKIELKWENECISSLISNDIYRCTGKNCADFSLIGTSPQNIFADEAESLKFDTDYTYKIESKFSIQTAKPTATATAFLGNLECWNKLDSNNFCISEFYYNQYKDYLIRNFAGFSAQNFLQNVKSTFSNRLNRAFLCNDANILKEEGTVCSSSQACVISNNDPICAEKSACTPDQSNLFGLFFTRSTCESGKYCFYDRSISTIDSCFACNQGMSCYDYKSRESCESNNCNAGSCEWKPISGELGTGVCIDRNADNCKWCDSPGTEELGSSKATSMVFEQCTEEKASLISNKDNLCYYDGEKALNCNNVICTDLLPDDCTSARLQYNEFNDVTNSAANKCGLKICQKFSGACKKNADNDNAADCSTDECEQDVFAPNTTIVPIIDRGLYKSLSIQIQDKASGKGSFTRRTTNDYRTYLCKEPCGASGHPYQKFTNSYSLIISNLNLFDSLTGEKILGLAEGTNVLRYYSQDPAKNIGKVKILEIAAQTDSSGPVVFRLNITNGKIVDNVYYTNSKNPVIKVEFFENAIVTSARLLLKGTEIAIIPDFSNQLGKSTELTFQRQINPGQYTFELNAKNEKGIFMSSVFKADIVVDDSVPALISIIPAQNTVVNSSPVAIKIRFNKKVSIDSIKISGKDFTGNFSTADSIEYNAAIALSDGNKKIAISARDFAGNTMTAESGFIVNSNPLAISIISPPFGVSPLFVFDLVVGTDNDAACRYSLDSNLEFNFMAGFDVSGSTEHKLSSFNAIPSGDRNVHKLYVRCNDPLQGQTIAVFDLSVDSEKPVINNAFAFPNPIVEIPRTTTLKVEADKESICKYSANANDFSLMESEFRGFGNNSFSRVNMQEITVQEDRSYSYFVACKSKSGLVSDVKQITFSSDITLPIKLISHTPQYINTSTAILAVETNKKSQCKYSSSDPKVSEGVLMGLPSYSHTKELALSPGQYVYYVICKDQFLQKWSDPLRIEFTIDTTAPLMVFVDDTSTLPDNPEFTWQTDRLRAKWLGRDNETKVSSYDYTLEEFGTLNTVINWTTSFIENEWIWISKKNSSLGLSTGSKYFFRVRARNIVGLLSNAMESDGITIDPSLKPTDCSNSIKDPQESDIDCGGPCDLCIEGKICRENIDCSSGFCSSANICSAATCSDNVKNQDEPDIDCGGNNCNKCENSRKCNLDSDCSSGSCSFGICSDSEACIDGLLTGTETDIDCGGACPQKCSLGKNCNANTDCKSGLSCALGKCSEQAEGEKDTDGDGIPDQWELLQGLDPNDPSDAEIDSDNDGLINLHEYTYSTDPNNKDTDGDGASDKKEIDKGTDPLDPLSKPKGIIGAILWVIITVIILGGAAYGAYYYYTNYISRPMPPIGRAMQQRPISVARRPVQKPVEKKAKPQEIFIKKEEERKGARGKLFGAFGGKVQQPAEKQIPKSSETAAQKQSPRQEKEDIFARLKLISKRAEAEKARSRPAGSRETTKKLREIAKKRKTSSKSNKR
ncbi:hypothetical protein HYU09_03290 [Candidatus Woesearchaeota archaeon]|nr:hypothetical protein [Candidatus Woesearchaeota archaeon]